MVFIDKPIPSSVSRGHDAVQRETRRQRVKRHMRVHTVAEPSNIQQRVHRCSNLCGLCDECSFQEAFFSAVGCPCMHQEAIMSECGQAHPEYIAPCARNNRVKAMEHRPQEEKIHRATKLYLDYSLASNTGKDVPSTQCKRVALACIQGNFAFIKHLVKQSPFKKKLFAKRHNSVTIHIGWTM